MSCRARAAPTTPTPDFQTVDWNDVERELRSRLAEAEPATGGVSAGPSFYVVIEKILGSREPLVDTWPVHGTSGYDFLN